MRIVVVGVGLIGGSIGLAAQARLGAEVVGVDADAGALARARQRGAVSRAAGDLDEALAGAEIVFLATPVGALAELQVAALAAAPPDCVVSDVGSTKRTLAGVEDERFVGGHPLAGAETAGVEHARADLFEGATWYLTPGPRTSGVLYERLHRALSALGAQPAAIDPATHDRLMATVSHLPHVLANVLVGQAAQELRQGGEAMPATGPSFRDATRVAGANRAIWTDIYLSNRDALLERLEETVSQLTAFADALRRADVEAVAGFSERAAADRQALQESGLSGGPLLELRASVPNRPGVIADIALALGRAGVNIVDLALSPSPDFTRGVVALWVRGEENARRALELIGELEIAVTRA
ncbi:MAG TPA: prephenate dehydrogenase/arogenate dehydrogenase family protein [Solirubrobacteraceae bacterium]|jgi:prephenate dehydrogenase|nr:prephenate dehydrogenase/arogenate dehydrogenase family protein [Solirubrobacteraceae bacterium]